ncbi:MAG: hypothetical protein HGGPFJEG_03085 [Ignavibacteria bacterium]|nr:hypothetical protein [Ignavibacteria bacterium]
MSDSVLIKSRTKGWDQIKLFNTIQDLSGSYFARIYSNSDTISISFYSRPNLEFVCKWKFQKHFYNTELKNLFNKHNSVNLTGKEIAT